MCKWQIYNPCFNSSAYGPGVRRTVFLLIGLLSMAVIVQFSTTESQWNHISDLSHALSRPPKHKKISDEKTSLYDERARVGKASILYGDSNPVYERALRTHKIHNRIHGYPFFIQRESILDGYWTKPAHLQAVVLSELEKSKHRRLEWLFWVDADTVLLNYQTPLESFLPPEEDSYLADIKVLVTEDWNGLNNGVFAVRVDKYAVELFAGILAFRDFQPNATLWFQDQSAMEMILQQRKFAKHKVIVPQRWFNAYKSNEGEELKDDQVRPGDLLVHFAGVGRREEQMAKWCEISEQRDPQWNKRPSETKYLTEIRKFWDEVKEKNLNIGQRWKDARSRLEWFIDSTLILSENRKNRSKEEKLKALSTARKEGKRVLRSGNDLEDNQLTEEDIRVFETAIREIDKAWAAAKRTEGS